MNNIYVSLPNMQGLKVAFLGGLKTNGELNFFLRVPDFFFLFEGVQKMLLGGQIFFLSLFPVN